MFDIREWIFFVSACSLLMPFNKKYQTKSYYLYSKLEKIPFEMKVQREVDCNVRSFTSYFNKICSSLLYFIMIAIILVLRLICTIYICGCTL